MATFGQAVPYIGSESNYCQKWQQLDKNSSNMDAKSCQKWHKMLNKSCQFWQLNIPGLQACHEKFGPPENGAPGRDILTPYFYKAWRDTIYPKFTYACYNLHSKQPRLGVSYQPKIEFSSYAF